ncbi:MULTISPECIES: LLM class oxidoreductase [Rhizobium/Agrobacterium group]|uniref:LLM class oxidoreductase n=1 Tax=Rhizobium/Agrobacterium group TaxID=227290 RepID=UPI0008DC1032|nr:MULTISPECIES: LLM class oxidoreductase [Rhizobium/Agrobacterium group]MCF1436497.1 LLM class oxidoreductase [Allorhizobium ampelinum]MCF1464484.1 LLM class oxidoreductase [Allorhizobium ampelinum]MCF1495852.1 LLM class oxidoreductase [Allorhizobium ampelinum]MUO91218.1 TIGR03571 family LLM class oxidoreductase [Agrobacterium vitis]MUZ54291.1 TIGR03571 family LLM class oxidoreductase [Agrobacterium vitis]
MSTAITTPQGQSGALDLIAKPDGGLTLGIELPLDNDWSEAREAQRIAEGRPFGVPDLTYYPDLVRQVDRSGFAAVWMRDVPVFDPNNFGDAGSVYDPFVNLGFLAGITQNVALGTAAVVLPLRHPMMVAKAAASVDRLSSGRLILGVASGDRPVEYPLLGLDFEGRGDAFRGAVSYMRDAWKNDGLPIGDGRIEPFLDLLPKPLQAEIPMVIAGQGRQTPDWITANMQGRFVYPNGLDRLATQAREWSAARTALGLPRGAFISAFHLDLAGDPHEQPTPRRFGARTGRNAFRDHLHALEDAGVNHLALLLRPSRRPLKEVIDELASDVLPTLSTRSFAAKSAAG